MALYDTMLSLKSPIGTHCLGFAFNLAGFILAAGQKVLALKCQLLLELVWFFVPAIMLVLLLFYTTM
jgi:ATP-dependent protease ClpP protease subunit